MGRQSEVYFKNPGFEHEPRKKTQDLHDNVKLNTKTGQTSKLVRHKSCPEIDLVSCLQQGWLSTKRRGKPGKSIVPFQVSPEKPVSKRKLELTESVEDNGINSDCYPQNKIIIDENGSAKDVASSEFQAPNKQYLCISCDKEFDSYFALGGHRAFHVREERKWCQYTPAWAALLYGPPPPAQEVVRECHHECPWCTKGFGNRQGLAAHTRFCHKKKEHLLTVGRRKKPSVVVRDFDLNELPREAFLPDKFLGGRTWR